MGQFSRGPLLDRAGEPAGFPGTCGDKLTKGEEALAFLFFDLSACLPPDTEPVYPPIIVALIPPPVKRHAG